MGPVSSDTCLDKEIRQIRKLKCKVKPCLCTEIILDYNVSDYADSTVYV